MRFQVHLQREVVQYATVIVDAAGPLEAAVAARQRAAEKETELNWDGGHVEPAIVTRADLVRSTRHNLPRWKDAVC